MLELILHYTYLGYKVSFERGAYGHTEVVLTKNMKRVSQQLKDDHITEAYLKETFDFIHKKFTNEVK
jgi:3-dehydroquinate dehydratase